MNKVYILFCDDRDYDAGSNEAVKVYADEAEAIRASDLLETMSHKDSDECWAKILKSLNLNDLYFCVEDRIFLTFDKKCVRFDVSEWDVV